MTHGRNSGGVGRFLMGMPRRPAHGRRQRRAAVEAREPRLLLSADFFGASLEAVLPPSDSTLDAGGIFDSASTREGSSEVLARETSIRELVFIDAGVEGYEALIHDLLRRAGDGRSVEVHVLDSGRDGIEQVSEILSGRSGERTAARPASPPT